MISVDNLLHCMSLAAARVGCRLGIHGWIYTERPYWVDCQDGERFRCRCLKRYCMHCGLAQRWEKSESRWADRTAPGSVAEYDKREAERLAENPPEKP